MKNIGMSNTDTKQSSISVSAAPKGGPSGMTKPKTNDV